MQQSFKAVKPLFVKTLLSSMIALSVSSVQAQTEPQIEEVLVVGQIQRNLQNALDVKRNSDVIVDGISSDDIDALPANDLGEALQVVPGVQLNREGERRESSINLRGLPSGFVRTTANGQSIASPTRGSQNDLFGAPSPFGAYDPSIFNGVDVIKTQNASMQEGGIAGAVNLKLPSALSKDNGGSIRVGYRKEDLPNEYDPEAAITFSHHLIEDVLAVTGAIGYSEQTFRQDSVLVNLYSTLVDPDNPGSPGRSDIDYLSLDGAPATIGQYKAEQGLPASAVIKIPSETRQLSEINGGDRLSAAGNIEWQATDELKLGASVILTERNMDDNRLEQIESRARRNFTNIGASPIARSNITPFESGQIDGAGNPVYILPGVRIQDTGYFYDNRQYNFLQESQAIVLDAAWETDDWIIDGAITVSDAKNVWDEILISPRAEAASVADATFYSGESDPSKWNFSVTSFNESLDFDGDTAPENRIVWNVRDSVIRSGAVLTNPGGKVLLMTGTFETVENDLNSFEANAEKLFADEGLTSFKFGLRQSTEESSSSRLRISAAGVDPTGVFTNAGRTAPSSQGSFFGNEIAGAADVTDGWYSFDFDRVNNGLIASIPTQGLPDLVTLPNNEAGSIEEDLRLPSGYVARANELGRGFDFNSELDITALYAMGNFNFELDSMTISGNAGLRYVSTDVETVAPVFEREGSVITNQLENDIQSSSYDNLLPSINANFDFQNDVILRLAYNESFVRPNLRAVSPQTRIDFANDGSRANITLPGTDLEPFEAQSLDASIEWYNTDSSSLSLAIYSKSIDNYFEQNIICDDQRVNVDLGGLQSNNGQCSSINGVEAAAAEPVLAAGADVAVTEWINSDSTIKVNGFEFSAQQNLSFLPYPWNGFGGVFNYTNVDQSSSGDTDIEIRGISDESYNIVTYYEQDDYGVRLQYNWRSDYDILASNTLFGEGVSTVKGTGRLDLSAYYSVTEDVKVSFKAFNLTEAIYEEYENVEAQLRRANYEGRTYVVSASYSF